MGAHKDQERNDAKVSRIVDACVRSMNDPRIPLRPFLDAEGIHPDNIARLVRYQVPVTLDGVARLLNYHFTWQTFAVVRKNRETKLVRVADGHELVEGVLITLADS